MKIPCPRCKGAGEVEISNLEILRERAKLSQVQLAGELGIKQPAYSHMIKTGNIPWRHRSELCRIFGVTREQLLGAPLDPKPARPKRAPPAGAIAKSRAHREAVKKKNKARSRK